MTLGGQETAVVPHGSRSETTLFIVKEHDVGWGFLYNFNMRFSCSYYAQC